MSAIPLRAVENSSGPANNAGENSVATFDDFWTLYPKRIARKEAERQWNRLSEANKVEALTALLGWRKVWLARGELQYTPNAGTWLHQERWTDELPADALPRSAAHAPAVLPADVPRGQMPDEVKAMLAKLRRK